MTRYIRWQMLLVLLGIVLVGILLTYLAINYTTVLRPSSGGAYVEGVAGFPSHLNPLLSGYNEVDRDICSLVFSGLTRVNESGEVEPDLARGWDTTLDGLTYTFYLRSNLYWHHGTPLTADDVIFTINLLKDPDSPAPPELGSNVWRTVKVERVDRRTVRFTLREPYAPFLDYTTVGILPSHLLSGIDAPDLPDAEFNLNPVGSGPFQLEEVEFEAGTVTTMVLRRFPRYHGERPYLDRIQFRFYPSYETALTAYEAGEVEGVARIPPDDLARARDLPSLNIFSAQIAKYSIVFLNLRRSNLPFFQEKEVRKALLHAVDRQQIIDSVLEGQALVADTPLLPGTWAYNDQAPRCEYDPDAANELLHEAGWVMPARSDTVRQKAGEQLAFTLLASNEPRRMEVAHMLAEQWEPVGVDATVETASPVEVRNALESRDFEAILVNFALPGDPDPYPFWHETQVENGQNYGGFVHRRVSEILEQARVVVDREKRKQLYYEFQEIFAREMPALLLYVPVYTYGIDERIHNVQIGPLMQPSDRFRTISDWWVVHRRIFVGDSKSARP